MFNEPIQGWLDTSIIRRAQKNNLFSPSIMSILESVDFNHHKVDDTPYGGGAGELMKIDIIGPLIKKALTSNPHDDRHEKRVILLDPQGQVFDQDHAQRLSQYKELIFVSGRYEGIDARVHHYVDEALSLGDFVMSSGDIAAMAICDAVLRLLPGVLNNPISATHESHKEGRLEASQYTRPVKFENYEVPAIFQSGDHQAISTAKQTESLYKTYKLSPDLFSKYPMTENEKAMLETILTTDFYRPWEKS